MRVMAGSFPRGSYALTGGQMTNGKVSAFLNPRTVESVQFVNSRTKGTPPSATSSVLIGGAVAGLPGMILGRMSADGEAVLANRRIVEFIIQFKDGRVAHCSGSAREYERALQGATEVERREKGVSPITGMKPSLKDRDRLRADLAAKKESRKMTPVRKAEKKEARKMTPERRAEKKARRKAVLDQNLPFREATRLLNEIDAEYR